MSVTDIYITDTGEISGVPPQYFLEELKCWVELSQLEDVTESMRKVIKG